MLIQVDFYKESGKWYMGGRIEINKLAHEDGILQEIMSKQDILSHVRGMYIVVSDIPESTNDPNYRTTYSRLYKPSNIEELRNEK